MFESPSRNRGSAVRIKEMDLQKHRCRICSRGFSSGRSLGGHMRSHIQASKLEAERKEKVESSSSSSRKQQAEVRAGYGLRENPRKTCRLSDFVEEDFDSASKFCGECGRGFPSWKAFFDHMIRFHSELTSNRNLGAAGVQEDGYCSSKKSFSDDDYARKRKLNRVSPIIEASSSTITDHESEQEDVAISLMMLSRDISGNWPAETIECSDKNSAEFEVVLPGEDFAGKSKMKGKMVGVYQCTTCKKKFQSYHALGGHRASHKRIKTCCLVKTKEEDNMVHECRICGKVFSSGNALGGHTRSHFVFNGGNGRPELVAVSEMLDLNLPSRAQLQSFTDEEDRE